MKRLYIIFLISVMTVLSVDAQQYGLHFMTDVAQSTLTNPGYIPRNKFVLSLPSAYYSLSAGNLNADLFRLNNNGLYEVNVDEVINTLDGDAQLRTNVHLDQLAIGFKVKKLYFTLNTATKLSAYAGLPSDFFQFVWKGNEPGKTMNFGPQVNVLAYQEIGLGVNYTFNRTFAVGARIKRLAGLALLETENRTLEVSTSDDIYQLGVNADYIMNVSLANVTNITAPGGNIQNAQVTTSDNIAFPGNNGWGIDLGTEINFKDKLRISAAILDLGAINWSENTFNIRGNGNYTFDGVDINVPDLIAGNELETGFVDSLTSAFSFEVQNTSVSKSLPTKTYVSATLRLLSFDVGVLAFAQLGGGRSYSTIALSLRKELGDILSLGVVYAYQTEGLNNLGVNAALKLGPLQAFVACDNIYPLINPAKIESSNIRVGVNIAIGTKKQKDFIKGKEKVDKD